MYSDEQESDDCHLVKRVNHLIPRNELGREGLKGDSEAPPSLILYKD